MPEERLAFSKRKNKQEIRISTDHWVRTLVLTLLALSAFAANSVLCRLALGNDAIDAAGFTLIRLLSGAMMLALMIRFGRNGHKSAPGGSWLSALMLFLYALCFSFAYLSLDTGTGALILFGLVQITIIAAALVSGERLHVIEWAGVILAVLGFIYLVLPGVTAPSLTGFLLMSMAGMAWGIYTIRGKQSRFPLLDTGYNFIRTLPFIAIVMLISMKDFHYSKEGILLASISGAVTSGIGYAIWYRALRGLSSTQSAVVQLSVPLLAAGGGILFMAEKITLRLSIAAFFILGGILLVVIARSRYLNHRVH